MTYREFLKDLNGYDGFTTFWDDFTIADHFGLDAVKDTFNRAFNEWRTDYKYLTELVLVLSHKCSFHYNRNQALSELYADLFHQANAWALDNLEGEEMDYFYHWTD